MDLEFQRQVDVKFWLNGISPVFHGLLCVDGRATICIRGGRPDSSVILFILALEDAEPERIAAAVSVILYPVDDIGVAVDIEIRINVEVKAWFSPFEIIFQIAGIAMVPVDVDGLAAPFAESIQHAAADGII